VEYIKEVNPDTLHDIMYILKTKQFEKGTVLLRAEENADSLLFVEDGVIELYVRLFD